MIAAVNPGKAVGKSKLQLGSKNQCSYGRNLTSSYDENIIVCERVSGYPSVETSKKQADENWQSFEKIPT